MTAPSLIDIVQGDGIALKQSGHNWMGLCPFHSEKSPSFSIFWGNQGKWVYFCHGCGASGDTADYLHHTRNISLKDALRMAEGDRLRQVCATVT